jgi:hypothetical protein
MGVFTGGDMICSVDLFYSKLFALLRAEKLTADLGITPIVTLRKTATEYDRKIGIKWVRCTAK